MFGDAVTQKNENSSFLYTLSVLVILANILCGVCIAASLIQTGGVAHKCTWLPHKDILMYLL